MKINPADKQKQEARAIKAMTETVGWQLVERDLSEKLSKLIDELIFENDEKQKIVLQAEIRVTKSLLNKITYKINLLKS